MSYIYIDCCFFSMVFSYEAVKMIIDLELCWCAGADSPDDMILGLCFKHLGIIAVHSPYFHQVNTYTYYKLFANIILKIE